MAMNKPRSLLHVAGILLGGLGIAICVAAMVFTWIASARTSQFSANVFGKIDGSLVAVRTRVDQARDRLREAKINTQDVETSLREWTRREAGERVALQLKVAEKTDKVSAILAQAGVWLEGAESSLGLVNEVLSSHYSSERAAAPSLEELVREIAFVRAQLAKAMNVVAGIRERIATAADEPPPQERIQQAVRFTLRLASTLGSVDSRLDEFETRCSQTQSRLQELQSRATWWIRITSVGVMLLILLLFAGQVALCRLSWSRFR
jgi:flagellin-like hook-associated protein FlgL